MSAQEAAPELPQDQAAGALDCDQALRWVSYPRGHRWRLRGLMLAEYCILRHRSKHTRCSLCQALDPKAKRSLQAYVSYLLE